MIRLNRQSSANSRSNRSQVLLALVALILAVPAAAQVITIDSRTGRVSDGKPAAATVDRRYQQITPTQVPLTKSELDAKTRLELIRILQSEQGFAMRPLPRGHKGLTLVANGKLEPAGEPYLEMVTSQGMCAKPGDRVVLTDVKIEHNKIIFDINGGPDAKHRFLRHVEIGGGPQLNPVVQTGNDPDPTGARLSLAFEGHIPELTGSDVKNLLAPLISFDVKTPIQAFTDTLPTKLKEAILNHHVLVGMSTDMLLFAKGPPDNKSREMDGQMPFEEWIYGKPPKEVDFVRVNGNRVIRVEVAKVGESPIIFTKDEVEGLLRTDGTPLEASVPNTRTIQLGDVQRDPNSQAPAAPPSIRKPGDTIPDISTGQMKPVQFPKPNPDDQPPVAHAPSNTAPAPPAVTQAPPADSQPADASQPGPPPPQSPQPPVQSNFAKATSI
ncbi:MAG: hypothetical protein ABSE46_03250 [Terracidiphilus sp.]|jgi:hypothetical protein